MVKYRDHRGTLVDSMKTVREINSMSELRAHLESIFSDLGVGEITVSPYGGDLRSGVDSRTGWDTHIVCIDGKGVGFTDGPINA